MSISVSCPACGKEYNLNETMVGKKVRCKHCAETFPVELDAVLPANDATVNGAAGVQNTPSVSRPLKSKRNKEIAEVERYDDDDEESGRKEPVKSGGFPWMWAILGGVACLLLLVCSGFGVGIYIIAMNVSQTADNVAVTVNNPPMPGPPQPIMFQPPPPPVIGAPVNQPRTVATAIADLQSGQMFQQQQAADWLAQTPANPADQPNVARALEPLLTSPHHFVKANAAKAMVNWAGPENVPALIRCIETKPPDWATADSAINALVRLKDKRAVPPIAKLLTDFGKREAAANALKNLGGPLCESEVAKYAFDNDNGTREKTQQLLKGYDTKSSVVLPQALVELKHLDANHRSNAAAWLSQASVDEPQRAAVTQALTAAMTDADRNVSKNAVKAMKVWATKENVPALIQYLDSQNRRGVFPADEVTIAMEVLVGFKDERAIWPIAQYCGNPFKNQEGRKYLQQLGPMAEAEVAKHLVDPDKDARRAAWKAIAVVGQKANGLTYQNILIRETDVIVQSEAKRALQEVAKRP